MVLGVRDRRGERHSFEDEEKLVVHEDSFEITVLDSVLWFGIRYAYSVDVPDNGDNNHVGEEVG
jgi:hypothetical protein